MHCDLGLLVGGIPRGKQCKHRRLRLEQIILALNNLLPMISRAGLFIDQSHFIKPVQFNYDVEKITVSYLLFELALWRNCERTGIALILFLELSSLTNYLSQAV
jgi:hypothetical protein